MLLLLRRHMCCLRRPLPWIGLAKKLDTHLSALAGLTPAAEREEEL